MPGSRKGGVLNLMVEVKVSKQSLLISRIRLIIDLEVLACLLFFLFFLYGSETRNKSKHIKLLKVTCVGLISPCSIITVLPKVQPGKQMRPDMSKSALNQATPKGASFFTPYARKWYFLFHSVPIAYTPFLSSSLFLPVLGCLDFYSFQMTQELF